MFYSSLAAIREIQKKLTPGEPVTFNTLSIIGYGVSRNTDDDVYYRY